ncbi:hypothetical protein ABPG72_010626 [Tetrahymena utriculariae]
MDLVEEIIIFLVGLLIFLKIRPQIYSKFDLYFRQCQKNLDIINNCPSIKKGRYFPTFYLSLGLLQAVFGSKSKHTEQFVKFRKQYITIADYGEFGVDWAYSDDKQLERTPKLNKMICIFPGLVSSINEPYIINILAKCYKHGYEVCLLNDRLYTNRDNGRGVSFPKNKPFTFVDDYKKILEIIKEQYQGYTFYAIGHSFGANTLARYLGLYANENVFSAAVCVSNPWDFYLGQRYLSKSIDQFLLNTRKKILRQYKHIFRDQRPNYTNYDYDELLLAKTCRELDNKFTSKLLGYRTADEYYKNISSIHYIDQIKIPVLFIQSKDDPILSENTLPIDEIKNNRNLLMIVTNTGGHVGWFEGLIQPKRWYLKPTLEFIDYLEQLN